MGQVNLHAPLDFLGFVPPRCYKNSPIRPKRQQITLTLKWVEASELFDNSNNSPRYSANFFPRTEGTEAAQQHNVSARTKKKDPKGLWGGEGGR